MAVAGRKLKPEEERRNRHAPTHDWTEVEDVPYSGPCPSLPPRFGIDPEEGIRVRLEWPSRTKAWWAVVRRMPHCVLWRDADWQDALDCAEVHARFVEGASGTELRIRTKRLGLTLDDRRDLRIRYVDPQPEQPAKLASVTSIDRYADL